MSSSISDSKAHEANGVIPDASLTRNQTSDHNDQVLVTCFSEDVPNGLMHFQIVKLQKQIYVWIGYNSTRFGDLYAAASTCSSNSVGVASLLGGSADNCGSSIARRLVLKTGLNVAVACNLPKDSSMLEASAERKLVEKLKALGLVRSRAECSATTVPKV